MMTALAIFSFALLAAVLVYETRLLARLVGVARAIVKRPAASGAGEATYRAVLGETRRALDSLRRLRRTHDAQFCRTELLLRGKLVHRSRTNHSHCLLAHGVFDAAECGHDRSMLALQRYCSRFVDIYGRWVGRCDVIDDYAVGEVLLQMHARTGAERFLQGAAHCANYLLNEHPRNSLGLLCYRKEFPEIMLVDDKGMICAFLVRFGLLTGDQEAVRLGVDQLSGFVERAWDQTTGLPHHAFNITTGRAFGPSTWLRGIGWLSLGLADVSALLPHGDPVRASLAERLTGLLDCLNPLQMPGGCWRWDVDNPLAAPETSGTAMIGLAIERACSGGVIDRKWLTISEKALQGILQHTLRNGMVEQAQSECEGIGNYSAKFAESNYAQGPATSLFASVRKRLS